MNHLPQRGTVLALLGGCCLVLATWQMGHGFRIYAKAGIAQWLLGLAWERTERGGQRVRPWPWADTWPIARLQVPAREVDLIVLEGARARTLAFGPGHLASSPYPGEPGVTILTGHRDTHFRFLRQLRLGDELVVRAAGGTFRYEVVEMRVVDSRTARISSAPKMPHLVLVTCYPFEAVLPGGVLRYVVTAVLR